MARTWQSFAWLAAPVIAFVLVVLSPLRVAGGDAVPGSLGGLALHCSSLTRLDAIDAVQRMIERGRGLPYWTIADDDGAAVSTWGPGPQVVASLGFHGVESGDTLSSDDVRRRSRYAAAAWVAIAIAIAAWWLARAHLAPAQPLRALAGSLAFALVYAAAPTIGQQVFQATVAFVPLVAGFVLVMSPSGRARIAAPGALLLAMFLRPSIFLLAIALGGQWLISAKPRWTIRQLAIATAIAIAMIAPICLWNLAHAGTILPLGQWQASHTESATLVSLSPAQLARGIAGLLASPARGLVWFAPIALVGAVVAWRRGMRAIVVGCAAQIVFIASWYDWWGGQCFGPRLIGEPAVILAAIALAHGLADGASRALRRVTIVAAVWTAAIGLLAMYRWDPSQWEARQTRTEAGVWNVVDGPLPALARAPLPMKDWLDRYAYRCDDTGVTTLAPAAPAAPTASP